MSTPAGKSQRVSRRFPTWVLSHRPDTRITIVSYETGVARRWGRAIRDDIMQHSEELGISVRPDVSAQSEFMIEGHEGGVFTAGIGSALTGRPSDLMIIDDPTKGRSDADSETYQRRNWEWYREVALTRLAPGAPVIITMTRWNDQDLGGMVLRKGHHENYRLVNAPAEAEEDDPLGREPGEWLETTRGMTAEQWEARKAATGPRSWSALYQGSPRPDEGGIFPADWPTYDRPHHVERGDGSCWVGGMERADQELLISVDTTFRDSKNSDYVVMQVWLRISGMVYLLDMIRRRMNFNDTLAAFRGLVAKWPQANAKLIEAKASGDAVINHLQREIPGIIPVEPTNSKTARAEAISPFAFSKNIVLPSPDLLPNVEELREEIRNFPHGKHDDMVDAMTQAVNEMLLRPLDDKVGQIIEPDEYDDDALIAGAW